MKSLKKKSFFTLPTEPKLRSAWIKSINCTNLPKYVVFVPIILKKVVLILHGSFKINYYLSIPNKFPHKEQPKKRDTSRHRIKEKQVKEV